MRISIEENGIWVGTGDLHIDDGNHVIENCPAVLADDQDMSHEAYDRIQQALDGGAESAQLNEYTYTWEIIE